MRAVFFAGLFGLATVGFVVSVVGAIAQRIGLVRKPEPSLWKYPSREARVAAKRFRTNHEQRYERWIGSGGRA